jgi:tryptophan-rich sensory protein
MKWMIYRLLFFLAINFGALALGGLFTSKGVPSDWYVAVNKAPWTPPGWMFGFAWTTIMICFSIYMAQAWKFVRNKKLLVLLYSVQWILNVGWSPVFFYYHEVLPALVIIGALTILMGFMLFLYKPRLQLRTLFVVPYVIWLCIATSLNAYIYLMN